MIRRSPRLALRGHIPPDGHGNAAGQRMFSRTRMRNQQMGDASSAFEADISDISRSSSIESLIPDKPCAIATMFSCLASVCHSMKSGIMCLYFLFLSRRTVCMKTIAVLLLLLFGVWFGYRQTQMENGVKFLTQTIEKQDLENKKLQTDMQELLILMRKIDSEMYKLHMATEQLRLKVKSQKSDCVKEAERIVHRALSLHRADRIGMAEKDSLIEVYGVVELRIHPEYTSQPRSRGKKLNDVGKEQKLKMFIGDFEDRLSTSAPLTSVSSSTSDPASSQVSVSARIFTSKSKNSYEIWGSPLARSSPPPTPAAITSGVSMGGNEGGGRGLDRWSLFGARPTVQKSPTDPGSDSNTSGGFSLQSYFGLQKSTTLDGIKTQVNLAVEDPANFKSPNLEVTGVEGKKASAHKLQHRDMNILTPSGF